MTTEERNAAIAAAYERGDTIMDICARFGVSDNTVRTIRKRAGLNGRDPGGRVTVRERDAVEFAMRVSRGEGETEAAKAMCLHVDTLRRACGRYGIMLDPPDKRQPWEVMQAFVDAYNNDVRTKYDQ